MSTRWESLRLLKKLPVTPFPVKGQRAVHLSEPVIGQRAIYCAYEKGDFTAFDRTTLEVLWKRPSEGFEPSYELTARLLQAGTTDGDIGCIEIEAGRRLWTLPTAWGATAWRGRLVVSRPEGFQVVDVQTGIVEKTVAVPGGITRPSLLCDDLAVLATRSTCDPVRAIDLLSGHVLWERPMAAEMESRFGIGLQVGEASRVPAFVCGSLPARFVATRVGSAFGCSLKDGSLLWHARVSVPYYWPNVHEGRIYVLSGAHFIAIDEASGEIVYDVVHPELGPVLFAKTGTAHAGKIAFASETGHLPVFDLADGRLVWLYQYKGSLGRTAEADGRLFVTTGRGELLVFDDR